MQHANYDKAKILAFCSFVLYVYKLKLPRKVFVNISLKLASITDMQIEL